MMFSVDDGSAFIEVEFKVEPNYAGWRLDKYLCQKIPRLSRTRVQQIIAKSLICERPLKAASPVFPGLKFRLRKQVAGEPETPREVGEVYRDESLLVLDKPAGLPMHPSACYHRGTLVTVLRERYGHADFSPVHRLDRETSGLVVCGRGGDCVRALMRAFVGGRVHKEYLAICEGDPPLDEFAVDAPIAEGSSVVRVSVRIDEAAGKPARTRFAVLRRFFRDGAAFSLLRAYPETGRQHQIRVHLKHAGFPVVGDKIYGPDPGYFDRFSRRRLEPEAWKRLRLPRQALHAALIRFPHPVTKREVSFESALPEDLQAFVE